MRGHDGEVVQHAHAVIEAGNAQVHAGVAACQAAGGNAGVFQRFPGQFQQQTLLRVEQFGFARRNAEEVGVELVDVREHAGGKGDAAAGFGTGGVLQPVYGPARGIDLGNEVLALDEGVPELLVAAEVARQAEGHANYRNRAGYRRR